MVVVCCIAHVVRDLYGRSLLVGLMTVISVLSGAVELVILSWSQPLASAVASLLYAPVARLVGACYQPVASPVASLFC